MTWSGRLLIVVLVAVSVLGCKPTLNGPCDATQLDGLRKATPMMDPANRALITAVGLSEACGNRLPSGIVELLSAVGHAATADRATIIAAGLAENPRFAKGGCADWETVVKTVGHLAPADRPKVIYEACHYERLGLFTVAELDASWKMSGLALVAAPMYAWLVDKGMEQAEAKRLARQMFMGEVPEPVKARDP